MAIIDQIFIDKSKISLQEIWQNAVNEQYAIALWRLPKQNELHFLADQTGKPKKVKIDFESDNSGFCISPFLKTTCILFLIIQAN
jgi:isochorismate synthase